jgi:uncharacterized alpha-E superfamily protein
MLSRVAENIYWMARYIERAENTARLINVNTFLLLDLPKRVRPGWGPLIEITDSAENYRGLYKDVDERSVVNFLIGDVRNPGSILNSLHSAREDARTVRDIIPREAWEQANSLYTLAKKNLSAGLSHDRRYEYLKTIVLGAQQITGLLAGTMTHDFGYDFLCMGRYLERADMTTRIIDVRSANLLPDQPEELRSFENIQWMSVLKSLSAYQMYRRQVRLRVLRPDVLKFLFQDRHFPRAFYYTVCELASCLENLPRSDTPLAVLLRLKRVIAEAAPERLAQADLHGFIDTLQLGLADLHTAITTSYFALESINAPSAVAVSN